MHVDVLDALHGIRSGVDHQPVAALRDALLLCDLPRGSQQPAHERVVVLLQIVDGAHVLVRDDQHVGGRCRADVVERGYVLVLVDAVGWDAAGDDAAEDAVVHAISPWMPSAASAASLTGVIWPSCRAPRAKTRR